MRARLGSIADLGVNSTPSRAAPRSNGAGRKMKQVVHSGYTHMAGSGLLDDPTIDQTKDHGHRHRTDRAHDDYGDSVYSAGDGGRRAPAGAHGQLHPGLWRPRTREYQIA